MYCQIRIDMDNEAFADDWKQELVRILREACDRIMDGEEMLRLRDINGNTVGFANVMTDED